jgi:hypothetical protein
MVRESTGERVERLRKELAEAEEDLRLEAAAARERTMVASEEEIVQRRGRIYSTWFKAEGNMEGADFSGVKKDDKDPSLYQLMANMMLEFDEDPEGMRWASAFNSAKTLGQVKWKGVRTLASLMRKLNRRLDEAETGDFDFREVYTVWSYRFFVLEQLAPGDEGGIIFDTGVVRGGA